MSTRKRSYDIFCTRNNSCDGGNNKEEDKSVGRAYDRIKEQTLEERRTDPLEQFRSKCNWVKALLIYRAWKSIDGTQCGGKVWDMACGRGGDLGKWARCDNIHVYHGTDVSAECLEVAKERNTNRKWHRGCSVSFGFEDFTEKTRVLRTVDIVSCQFAAHYAFRSKETTKTFFQNVSSCLRRGGHFIGTTVRCEKLMDVQKYCAENPKDGSIGLNIPQPTQDTLEAYTTTQNGGQIITPGNAYTFRLGDRVDCDEFVVDPRAFKTLAKHFGLECKLWVSFEDFTRQNWEEHKALAKRMNVQTPITHPHLEGLYLLFDFVKT
jgi:mRNA (guanine-N7-)-methyltransferase